MRIILRFSVLFLFIGTVALLFWASRSSAPAVLPAATYAPASTSPEISGAEDAKGETPAQTSPQVATSYTGEFKKTMTTYFFVGEPSEASNAFIPNDVSYWDDAWQKHFGGADSPDSRCGFNPCGFVPLENPFYVALPYAEFDPAGNLKDSAKTVPWYEPGLSPLLKNHWVEIVHNGNICFAQWEDVGPNNEDDFAYVFGSSTLPINTFGEKAGLDVSPAVWKCLGMTDNDITSWRFVDASDVDDGPWKDIVTSLGISWGN